MAELPSIQVNVEPELQGLIETVGADARAARETHDRHEQVLVSLAASLRELAQVTHRMHMRVDAALRGVKLGRPTKEQSDAKARESSHLFPDLEANGNAYDVSLEELLVEGIAMAFAAANVEPLLLSTDELAMRCQTLLEKAERPWPFSSTKHFGRRIGMTRQRLLSEGFKLDPYRDDHGKRHWRIARAESPSDQPKVPSDSTGKNGSA